MCCKEKECKIVCDGKEIATISHKEDGLTIKATAEGKALFKGCKECC